MHHAKASASRFGGSPSDYLPIHEWLDQSRSHYGDFRHRALLHHTLGVHLAVERFGDVVRADGKDVPVRLVVEQHIHEDLGWIPTPSDWLQNLSVHEWMNRPRRPRKDDA